MCPYLDCPLCEQAQAAKEAKSREEQKVQAAKDAKAMEQKMFDREQEKREREERREKELLFLLKQEGERNRIRAIQVGA
jgi:hypothetical protein